jgi:alcohol dehydrogenase class IV
MRFEFATATRILFGAGTVGEAASAAKEMGQRAFLVTGASRERHRHVADLLQSNGVETTPFTVVQEPGITLVQQGIELARHAGCDLVIAVGGGSAIDAGKAVAALLTNEGMLIDYLEVIGGGRPLARPATPFIAIPTTAGTGSEVTRNAVLASPEHKVKASMRSPLMLPRLAIVDPELTYNLPPEITASTGLDALTQLIEPYVSVRANSMTDVFCLEGMCRAARSLHRAFRDGSSISARADMAFASLMGGLALANAGLGVVHGFAAPIGGIFPAPHGAVCAALLGPGMAANIRALRSRVPESEFLARYQKVAAVLTGNPGAAPEEGPEFVRILCAELAIPPLRSYGIVEDDVAMLVAQASRSSSMRGNPLSLAPQELAAVLIQAL